MCAFISQTHPHGNICSLAKSKAGRELTWIRLKRQEMEGVRMTMSRHSFGDFLKRKKRNNEEGGVAGVTVT